MASINDSLSDFTSYVHNRWVHPSHKVIIDHPQYGIGNYHDSDDRMLFSNFQLLVDYVEIECANMYRICSKKAPFDTCRQKAESLIDLIPFVGKLLPPSRNALQGLFYLKWELSLKDDSPSQAAAAKEILALYKFWVHTRPERRDPWDIPAKVRDKEPFGPDGTFKISPKYSKALRKADQLESKYNREDTKMLTRLMKIRNCMWT